MIHLRSNQNTVDSVQFRRLSPQQCQKIYWTCLEILESTGVRLYHQGALELLQKGKTDVVLTMGAGDIDRMAEDIVEVLKTKT